MKTSQVQIIKENWLNNNFFSPQDKIKQKSQFGKWQVSKSGNMIYDNGNYYIYDNQLKEEDWIAHMFEKSWIDWNEFIPAYFQALKNADIQFKRERVFY